MADAAHGVGRAQQRGHGVGRDDEHVRAARGRRSGGALGGVAVPGDDDVDLDLDLDPRGAHPAAPAASAPRAAPAAWRPARTPNVIATPSVAPGPG